MTESENILKRAPKGWEKPRDSNNHWRPSKASDFDQDEAHLILGPRVTIGSSDIHPLKIEFEDNGEPESFAVTVKMENYYFEHDEESDDPVAGEVKQTDFLDFEDNYEIVISFRNMTEYEAKKKAKDIMQRIQSKKDLAKFVKEKRKVLYGIDSDDLRKYEIDPFLMKIHEEEGLGRTNRILFLSDDKDSVEKLTSDNWSEALKEQAKRYKENIDQDLKEKNDKLKSIKQTWINFSS